MGRAHHSTQVHPQTESPSKSIWILRKQILWWRRRRTQRKRERLRETVKRKAKMAKGSTGEFFKRRDAWRKHPMLSNQLRHATPGLGIGLVAFGIYLVGEQIYNRTKSPSSHHSHASSSSHASHWSYCPIPQVRSISNFIQMHPYISTKGGKNK